MPAILAEVAARAPELKIEVMDASEEQLDRALAQRELDLVFATRPPSEVEALEVGSARFTDRCVVFCASNHPLAALERPAIEAILQQPWALDHPGATTRQQLQGLVAKTGHSFPPVALQTSSVDLIISLVSKSRILGWLPEPLLGLPRQTGTIAVLPAPKLELVRTFRAYRRSRGTFPAGVQVFIDAMASVRD
jgi:DNA-binding transcriptional LysR family regulator